ncbi:exopolyphosphatase/guanosine-5'-triphosphate,3'-diphosphate pyrophosphatase [Saccharothrix ecbatanensis]|uniref:Exopolyphosphatase/guanosine-5'-triphosphate, 3'-diphosphate pyrophosphatase n=1 Tax=Saccharothrix ecbatanensis TaxID=1105145 RepID=A0A7W9M4X5_9PSEU|nr:Ppx/GppA phosphatase family protein [Saccharothrix ecbatanensis]MBB5807581.1 exopolyphosphatase/guanosine-5'-triphosphate,3'-diphosphate pyrophosphatase [Saccharothrix ecbatanensis]
MARVAAIDCGTNSIRLLVADVTTSDSGERSLRDVHREMRVVRLGQGVDATGELHPDAIARTRAALVDYTNILRRKGTERVRMVATSATRDAANKDRFFDMTREVLGVEAEVITGDEEARLSFTGAVSDLDPGEGPFLVSDIGGGSTELVLGAWNGVLGDVEAARSVDIGCVRLTERCLRGDPPTEADVEEAVRVTRDILAEAFEAVPTAKTNTWIGVAGTVTTLVALTKDLPQYDPAEIHLARIGLDRIRETTAKLLTMSHDERAALGPMHPGRVDVICGGALIVRTLADHLESRGVTELVSSEHDILDGIAFSLA